MTSIKDSLWTVAGIAIGGTLVYGLYSCYSERGSIAPSALAVCFIEGTGSTLWDVAKDLGKDVYDGILKPVGKGAWKGIKKGADAIDDKVIDPAGDFFKHDVGGAFKKTGHAFEKAGKDVEKGLKKAFSKDSMKKGFKKIFHI